MKHIEVAFKYLMQKELPGNVFDPTTMLGKLLHGSGQKDGEAWCAYFVEGVFSEAYPDRDPEFQRLFSASAVKTFDNFLRAKYPVSKVPHRGDVVIWKRYKEGLGLWQGHAGIVTEVINENRFKTIEGNTNGLGSREGDSVQQKERTLSVVRNGLNVLGFIKIA
jgi:hypothetical protein